MIILYARDTGSLPTSLGIIPEWPDRDSEILDGWGREIRYSVDEAGIVTLSSFGKDGTAGGKGSDSDMIYKFSLKEPDGQWEASDVVY